MVGSHDIYENLGVHNSCFFLHYSDALISGKLLLDQKLGELAVYSLFQYTPACLDRLI